MYRTAQTRARRGVKRSAPNARGPCDGFFCVRVYTYIILRIHAGTGTCECVCVCVSEYSINACVQQNISYMCIIRVRAVYGHAGISLYYIIQYTREVFNRYNIIYPTVVPRLTAACMARCMARRVL